MTVQKETGKSVRAKKTANEREVIKYGSFQDNGLVMEGYLDT